MKKILLVLVMCLAAAGCQDVTLRGQAMTAAETSTLHAFEAHKRYTKDPAAGKYLKLNAEQWRHFVRSAKRDNAWGQELDR